jgi:hypothetical protein
VRRALTVEMNITLVTSQLDGGESRRIRQAANELRTGLTREVVGSQALTRTDPTPPELHGSENPGA